MKKIICFLFGHVYELQHYKVEIDHLDITKYQLVCKCCGKSFTKHEAI